MNINRKAFTLAEVLVTLGIIGVVSAMTVPTLMQNYQRKSYVTQLHKVYNEIQQAFNLYMNDRNAINLIEAGFSTNAQIDSFVNRYFKVIKTCSADDNLAPCFASSYTDIDNTKSQTLSEESDCRKAYVLASGAAICFAAISEADNQVNVDINGSAPPNIAGRDLFYMGYINNGTLDEYGVSGIAGLNEGDPSQLREEAFNNSCTKSGSYAIGCFGKILNDNWEMNY